MAVIEFGIGQADAQDNMWSVFTNRFMHGIMEYLQVIVIVSILRGCCPRVKFCRTGSPCAAAGCVRQCARLLPRPSAAAGPYPVPKVLPTSSSSAPRFPAVAPRAVLPPRLRMVANVSLRQSRLLYRCEYVTSYAQGNPLPSAHLSPPRAVDNPCRQLMSSEK